MKMHENPKRIQIWILHMYMNINVLYINAFIAGGSKVRMLVEVSDMNAITLELHRMWESQKKKRKKKGEM